jgi:hypothetical protein
MRNEFINLWISVLFSPTTMFVQLQKGPTRPLPNPGRFIAVVDQT